MVQLREATKIYANGQSNRTALNKLDLSVSEGEYIAVMGASGCGKSTLLNILGCMDTLTSGEYYFDNVCVSSLATQKLHRFRKEHIGFVFQNFALMNRYTIYENVELPLLARGVPLSKRKAMALDIMEALGIGDLRDQLPMQTSGGQQQRTAIARAIVSGNPLLLADEPTGALDQRTGNEIMNVFDSIHKQGKTIILVTHDEKIANRADRIIWMEDGNWLEKEEKACPKKACLGKS